LISSLVIFNNRSASSRNTIDEVVSGLRPAVLFFRLIIIVRSSARAEEIGVFNSCDTVAIKFVLLIQFMGNGDIPQNNLPDHFLVVCYIQNILINASLSSGYLFKIFLSPSGEFFSSDHS
jgi:hypothetical protein